jgi:hypothetical protein
MATILKAGNVASGAQITSDATGILEIRTGTGAGTTAITVGTDQAVTFAAGTTYSAGAANGVLYLNGSKVATSGSVLTFDGTKMSVGNSNNYLTVGTSSDASGAGVYSTFAVDSGSVQIILQRTGSGAGWGAIGATSTLSFTNFSQSFGAQNFSIKQTDGTVILKNGDAGANGTGITFPATQNASSNVNTLDDYEEGTWTPTDTSGAGLTLTGITSARYVKIGKRVFCDLEVGYPTTSNTSLVSIGGLPYVSANETIYGMSACMNDANLNVWAFVNLSTTNVAFYKQAPGYTQVTNAEFSGRALYISIAYNAVN